MILRFAGLMAACLLLGGCGIDVRQLEEDQPLDRYDALFESGRATVDDVLSRFGPPARIGALPGGHWLEYRYRDLDEFRFQIRPLMISKIGGYGGGGEANSLLVVFDEQDRLVRSAFGTRPLNSGFGGALGVFRTLFEPFRPVAASLPGRTTWAAELLAPVPSDPRSDPSK